MIAVVLGARGGTGKECVLRLAEKGADEVKEIRAVIRNPSVIQKGFFPEDARIKVVAGDVTKEDSLNEVLKGATHAIFTAAGGKTANVEVDEHGLKKTLVAAENNGLKRVSICSSMLVDPVNKWVPIRLFLNTIAWGLMDSKFRGENHVREFGEKSRVEYCIVRPGRLIDGQLGGSGEIMIGQTNGHFGKGGASTRADVARVIVETLKSAKTRNVTFEMAGNAAGKQPAAIEPLFSSLRSDIDRKKDTAGVKGCC